MLKETKVMILGYALPIVVLSLILSFIHPIVAQAVLWMVGGSALLCIGMLFFVDYLDKKM